MSPSLIVPSPTNEFKKLFVYESAEAVKGFLEENKLNINETPLLIPFISPQADIQFLKPGDGEGDGCIRIMGARNQLRDKSAREKCLDWFNRELLGRDFAPHLNDLDGDSILLDGNGLIVIYQRAKKEGGPRKVGTALAEFFREQREILSDEIKRSDSNDAAQLNIGRFTQGLTNLGMDLGIDVGMTYFIKNGEVFRHTFKAGVSERIVAYLNAEPADVQEVRVNYNKTQNNHILPFFKDWVKWTVFAVITAIGVGFFVSGFYAAFVAAPIAVMTFVGLSFFAFYKASKDNPSTIEYGKTEFKTIKPEALKQENSIFNELKSNFLMVVAYLRGKSFADKQVINPVSAPVQNEVAETKLPAIVRIELKAPVLTIEKTSSMPVMNVMPTRITAQRSSMFSTKPEATLERVEKGKRSNCLKPIGKLFKHMRRNKFNNSVYSHTPRVGMVN